MGEAVGFHAYGGPDVLRLLHVDVGAPAAGQVRVRVRAAGVNPVDCKVRRGDFAEERDVFPQRLGNEFAGTVEQVGPGVTGLAPGDDVVGFTVLRAYATAIVVDAAQVTAKPEPLSWPVAGSLSAVGQAAHGAVRDLRIARGDTVLIHGAAGGVGTVAVQLARRAGATVLGTAHPDDADHVRVLGAVPVAYGDGAAYRVRALAPQGVDAALDTAGGEALAMSVALAADRSRVATLADADAAQRHGVRRLRPERSATVLAELAALAAEGELHTRVARTFPLSDAASAHRTLEAGRVRGRIVLLPA